MYQVLMAKPYHYDAMSSTGNASSMLLRQSNFPNTYDKRDVHTNADHDRCMGWDYKHALAACQKHMHTGDMGIGHWVQNLASHDEVIAFFVDILKADEQYPGVKWTGFRLLGTVNRSNGFPVYTLELFAKHPDTDTEVYTGQDAPNVKMETYDCLHLWIK